MTIRLLLGDCRVRMKELADSSVDSIVTDPPYELTAGKKGGSGAASVNLDSPYGRARIGTGNGAGGFMGMKWDATGVAFDVETWKQALRVLKPGGHLLAFSGTRTYHRIVCAIEDAGFEIRDSIGAIVASDTRVQRFLASLDDEQCRAFAQCIDESQFGGLLAWVYGSGFPKSKNLDGAWEGWGTALKPAWEPICMARKPLQGTVAANVLQFGTGALNIDGCRVPTDDKLGGGVESKTTADQKGNEGWTRPWMADADAQAAHAARVRDNVQKAETLGRWPANLIHDGSEEVIAAFPYASGAVAPVRGTEPTGHGFSGNVYGAPGTQGRQPIDRRDGGGSAARFFYTAKASRHDRNDGLDGMPERPLLWSSGEQSPGTFQSPNTHRAARNHHPTVKPTDLMRYLCRLVTPPGGLVLDPFMDSGSTLKAAELEGFSAIGIELSPEYIEIARRRIAADTPLLQEAHVL